MKAGNRKPKAQEILEGASAIRPYLRELLGRSAKRVDTELAALIARSRSGDKVGNLVLDLLSKHDATREWLERFLRDLVPLDIVKFYKPPAGSIEPIAVDKYACPQGDYTWYRRTVGLPVPLCPTHGIQLKLAKNR